MKFNENKSGSEDHKIRNFEGGVAYEPSTPEMGLYKLTINNLLEDSFYETDTESFGKIMEAFKLVAENNPEFALKLATFSRNDMYLRDISQLLLVFSANHEDTQKYVKKYIPKIIQRADELNTVTAIQLNLFGKPIPKCLKKGLRKSFHNFDRYQFAKYNRTNKEVKFRDVMNLVHPKPENKEEEEIFESIIKGNLDNYPEVNPLKPPKTWEVTISEKGNTKEAWEEVLPEMGLFAKIRNVRNMLECGIDGKVIFDEEDMKHVKNSKIYPFRFYQSWKAMKNSGLQDDYVEDWLSEAIDVTAENLDDKLTNTFTAVDLSGSMESGISRKSMLSRKEISALFGGIMLKNGSDVGAFGEIFKLVTAHKDTPTLELQNKIERTQVGHSTNGHLAIEHLIKNNKEYDRIVIFTDMQMWDSAFMSDDSIKDEFDRYREEVNSNVNLYILDLASYGDLVTPEGYQNVYNISGWTSKLLDFIEYVENPREIVNEIENYEK